MTGRRAYWLVTLLGVVVALGTAWGCYTQTWDGAYDVWSTLAIPVAIAIPGLLLMLSTRTRHVGMALVTGSMGGLALLYSVALVWATLAG